MWIINRKLFGKTSHRAGERGTMTRNAHTRPEYWTNFELSFGYLTITISIVLGYLS